MCEKVEYSSIFCSFIRSQNLTAKSFILCHKSLVAVKDCWSSFIKEDLRNIAVIRVC